MSAKHAHAFAGKVPPLFGYAARTRYLIALSVNGPGTAVDLFSTVADTATRSTVDVTLEKLEALGLVASKIYRRYPIYYINPGHPASKVLRELCKVLSLRWGPVPVWEERHPGIIKVPLTEPIPCNLFGREETTRLLLLIMATGRLALRDGMKALNLTSWPRMIASLERFVDMGLLRKEIAPWPDINGYEIASRVYEFPRDYFAFTEMRRFVGMLMRRVHPDILGIAEGLGRRKIQGLRSQRKDTRGERTMEGR